MFGGIDAKAVTGVANGVQVLDYCGVVKILRQRMSSESHDEKMLVEFIPAMCNRLSVLSDKSNSFGTPKDLFEDKNVTLFILSGIIADIVKTGFVGDGRCESTVKFCREVYDKGLLEDFWYSYDSDMEKANFVRCTFEQFVRCEHRTIIQSIFRNAKGFLLGCDKRGASEKSKALVRVLSTYSFPLI